MRHDGAGGKMAAVVAPATARASGIDANRCRVRLDPRGRCIRFLDGDWITRLGRCWPRRAADPLSIIRSGAGLLLTARADWL
jgi:hypothetical protein